MIIKTANGTYRPGDDEELDQSIQISTNAVYVVGSEIKQPLSAMWVED